MNIRMSNIGKCLLDKVKKVRFKPFFIRMQSTLAYNMLISFAFVLVFIWGLYLLMPREAHVDLSTSEITEIRDITSDYINAELTFDTDGFFISDFDHITMIFGSDPVAASSNNASPKIMIEVEKNESPLLFKAIEVISESVLPFSASITSFEQSSYSYINENSRYEIATPLFFSEMEFASGFSISSEENLIFNFSDRSRCIFIFWQRATN